MCGITGIVGYSSVSHMSNYNLIKEMNRIINHRGPDGSGIHHESFASLGHVRLSIIDVQGSKQPLSNEDQSVWITFNGEIYNYKDLRLQLLERGHKFRTQGDTEVLVHLYEEYGVDMLSYLQGMFSFAILDKKKKRLFCARDRIGIKPFYYYYNGTILVFASEPKAIFASKLVKAQPNEEGIWNYLTYKSVPAPHTMYKGIKKLPAGHFLLYDPSDFKIKVYWDIPVNRMKGQNTISDKEALHIVDKILTKSVTRRLVSDVPVGAFLSGGVDSSLIVALMSKQTDHTVKTYSVGFEDLSFSELPYARKVAEYLRTDHHELLLKEESFSDNLEYLTWIRDCPLSEPGDVPLYLLSSLARDEVKVLLSGEGSDELFAGYPKYAYDRFSKVFGYIPGIVTETIAEKLPEKYRRFEIAVRNLSIRNDAERFANWFSPFNARQKEMLVNFDVLRFENPTERYYRNVKDVTLLDAMLYCDCKIWLVENLLNRGDSMTMGASIENRVPFLDHELIQWAFTLPARMKIRYLKRKWLIKQVALQYLPEGIVNRPKIGFKLPLADWFRGKLKEMCYDLLCERNSSFSVFLSTQEVKKILDRHCSMEKDYHLQIWALLGLCLWFKKCLK